MRNHELQYLIYAGGLIFLFLNMWYFFNSQREIKVSIDLLDEKIQEISGQNIEIVDIEFIEIE